MAGTAPPTPFLKKRVSQNNGRPWTQDPEYIETCRTIPVPGDPTAYNPAHPQGTLPTDVTQFQVGLARFNVDNLPNVFYDLRPSKEWWDHAKSAKPPQKMDANGNLMYERTPRNSTPCALLDYPILRNLDTISSTVPSWFIEILMRMDGRLEWADILMRMEYPGTSSTDESKFRNRLQQRMARAREKFSMVAWRDTSGDNNAIRDRVLNKLTPAQHAARGGLGTTRGSTPGSSDSQGKVIPLPGRRPRGTANAATNTAAQKQQPHAAVVKVAPSNAASQQQYPATYTAPSTVTSHPNQPVASHRSSRSNQQTSNTNFVNVNRQQSQTTASYGALPVHKSNMYAGAPQATFRPVNRVHRSSGFGNPMTQQRHLPSAYTANENLQQSQNLTSHAGSSNGHYNEYGLRDEDSLTGEYIQSVASHAGPSASHHNAAHSQEQSSSEEGNSDEDGGSDGDCEGEEEDESEESESEANSENDENHGNEEPDAEMSSAEADPRMAMLTAEERRELERYLEQDRINTQMYGTGAISGAMLLSDMASNEGQFRSGLKRVIGEKSDDDEAEDMQNQRAKRTKRGGDAAGAGSQTLPQTPNPGPWGENIRQGALVNTSRRPATRPLGSAVERLHNDRIRRPTPKATQNKVPELLYESRPDLVMGGEEYIVNYYHDQPKLPHYDSRPNTDFPQPGNGMGSSHRDTHTPTHPSEYRQRHAGSERTSLALNPTVEDSSRNTPAQAPQNPMELARNHVPTASRRTPQQPTSNTVQDDPFFSDELFNGMLNGQPDANHVGSIYTRSQQNEIDQYYQRLMDPRPGDTPDSNAENNTTPPPPQQFRREDPSTVFVADLLNPHARPQAGHGGGAPQAYIPFNIPNAPAQGGNAPLVPQVPPRAPRPTEGPEMGLNIGNIAGWDPGWSAFVNDHDGEPLLRGQYPDEYP